MLSKPRLLHLLALLVSSMFVLSGCAKVDLNELESWDLLWISDSSGWDVAPVYAKMIEEDTGKTVTVHDYWLGGLSAGEVHSVLDGEPSVRGKLNELEAIIKDSEVIVFYANSSQSIDPDNPADWSCIGGNNYVNACGEETFIPYILHLEGIYAKILKLRRNQPTIIRAYDAYNPVMRGWEEDGVYDACFQCWRTYNTAIHQAAATHNIPVALVAEAWNGPDFTEYPADKGYLKDGEHPNEAGAIAIAEAIRALGYEPVNP